MSPEDTFDLLAEAAGVKHPNPSRDNRGLCPAHDDHSNPALVFRIGDSGHLIAYCHSQHCTVEDLAKTLNVSVSSFFAGSDGKRFGIRIPIEYTELSVLELLKLVPFGYDFDTQVECVFTTLDLDLDYSERPLRDMTKTELSALSLIWLNPMFDHAIHGDWWDNQDRLMDALRSLNTDTRTSGMEQESATPRRRA